MITSAILSHNITVVQLCFIDRLINITWVLCCLIPIKFNCALLLLRSCRPRGTVPCWVCALAPLWTAGRWGHPSGWLGTWSPGAPPSLLPTFTSETAWPQIMARSTQLLVQRNALSFKHWYDTQRHERQLVMISLIYSSRMFQWGSTTSSEERGEWDTTFKI